MSRIEVKRHDNGIYYVRPYSLVNRATGEVYRRPYKRFPEAADEEEAGRLAAQWAAGVESGAIRPGAPLTLTAALSRYVDGLEAMRSPDNTVKAYRGVVSRYIAPNVGDMELHELTPRLVESLYNVVMLRGGHGGKPVSANTVIQMHWFLSGAFRWLVRHEYTPFNPMAAVDKPRPERMEAAVYDERQFAALSSALEDAMRMEGTDREAVFERNAMFAAYLSLWNGERCGEVCANSVSDARLGSRTMHVAHTMVERRGGPVRQARTKGGRSRNVAMYEGVCERIRAHYEWQASYLPEDIPPDDARMICCDRDGGYLRPSRVSEAFSSLRDRIGLPKGTSFHTLRHTHATYLLLNGADMRTVQERLGHANVATTLGLYAHVIPGRDQQAADAFAGVAGRIGGGP